MYLTDLSSFYIPFASPSSLRLCLVLFPFAKDLSLCFFIIYFLFCFLFTLQVSHIEGTMKYLYFCV